MTDSSVNTTTTHDGVQAFAAATAKPSEDTGEAVFRASTEPVAEAAAAEVEDVRKTVTDVDAGVDDVEHDKVVAAIEDVPVVEADVTKDVTDGERLIAEIHSMVSDMHGVVSKVEPFVTEAMPKIKTVVEDVEKNGIGALLGSLMAGSR